jgi:hypothetical protein
MIRGWSSLTVVPEPPFQAIVGEIVPKENRKIAVWIEKSEHCISCLFRGGHSRETKLNDPTPSTILLSYYDQFFQSSA